MTMLVRNPVRGTTSSAVAGGESPFRSILTQPSSNPSEPSVQLAPTEDGVMIYLADAIDYDTHHGAFVTLLIAEGTEVFDLVVLWRQAYCYRAKNAGSAIAIGAMDGEGIPVRLPITVAPMKLPSALVDVAPGGATGIIQTDEDDPEHWSPSAVRLTLPGEGLWFNIDYTGGTRQRWAYLAERADSTWGPMRAVLLVPGRKIPVFARTSEIAFCSPDALSLAIEAPAGSILSGAAPNRLTWMNEFTPTRTVTITNASEFNAAIAGLQDGDDLVITAASLTPSNVSIASFEGRARIRGATNIADSHQVTANWSIAGASEVARFYFANLRLEHNTATTAGIVLGKGIFRLENVKFVRQSGSVAAVMLVEAGDSASDYRFFQCHAIGSFANANDVWSYNAVGSTETRARARMIGCTGSGAGSLNVDNLVTTHNFIDVRILGGTFTDPGNGPTFTGATQNAKLHLVGVYADKGSTSRAILIGANQSYSFVTLGCHLKDVAGNTSLQCAAIVASRIETTGADQTYCTPPSDSAIPWYMIASRFIHSGTGGVLFQTYSPRYLIVGCQATGYAFGFWIMNPASSQYPQAMWNNSMPANIDINRADQPDDMEFLFNQITGNILTLASTTNAKNILGDGNLVSGSISSNFSGTGTNQRSVGTPIAQSASTSPTNLDAEGTPLATSNLDWSTFTSALSAGDKQVLRQKLTPKLGFMGVRGDVLYVSDKFVTRGPRQRAILDGDTRLFPTVR